MNTHSKCGCSNTINVPTLDCSNCSVYVTTLQIQDLCVLLSNLATTIVFPINPAIIAVELGALQVYFSQLTSTCFSYTFLTNSIQNILAVLQSGGSSLNVMFLLLQLVNALEQFVSNFIVIGTMNCLLPPCLTTSLVALNNAITLAISTDLLTP
ncbi:hypothetical protein [Bacillus thuringiensis]|uniref:hypothetical protein n=1 Tax=Bacillus thuringiensis TaxID=1428 RepID=UPI003B980612